MKRDAIDFHEVKPQHYKVHERLENWARSQDGVSRTSSLPMWRYVRSEYVWAPQEPRIPVDSEDAGVIGRTMHGELTKPQLLALSWCYIDQGSPVKATRKIGCSYRGLIEMIHAAREIVQRESHRYVKRRLSDEVSWSWGIKAEGLANGR